MLVNVTVHWVTQLHMNIDYFPTLTVFLWHLWKADLGKESLKSHPYIQVGCVLNNRNLLSTSDRQPREPAIAYIYLGIFGYSKQQLEVSHTCTFFLSMILMGTIVFPSVIIVLINMHKLLFLKCHLGKYK